MCFLLFPEPSRCSPHAGVSRCCSLVAIFHDLVHLTFANLWQSYHSPALLSISFVPSTSKCSVFTGPLSLFFISTCPNRRNLCSFTNSSNLSTYTPVISRILSMFILSFKVFTDNIHNILIFVVFNFLSSSTFKVQHSAP